MMSNELLIVGGILLVMGFLVGIKKQTWLLSGFNEKRVSDKKKLSLLVGGYTGIMSIVFLTAGLLSFQQPELLFAILVGGMIALLVYVNVKMVD